MARDWSNLNYDILRLVAGKVRALEDYVRLSLVSSSWLSVLMKQDGAIFCRPHLPPRLILPCSDHEHDDTRHSQSQCHRTFSIMDNKVNHLYFPQAYGKKCVGSSHGWLIMVEDTSPDIFMLNPLTRKRIELPSVTSMPEILGFNKENVGREYHYFNMVSGTDENWMSLKDIWEFFTVKIILSHDPEEENCIAVAICCQLRLLVFCRIGDIKWTHVKYSSQHDGYQNDMVYFKDKFYVVNCNARVGVFDARNPQLKIIHEAPYGINTCHAMYLVVDTTGSLLLISRYVHIYENLLEVDDENDDNMIEEDEDENQEDNLIYSTRGFKVFKLDEEKNKWKNVKNIGENIIFLGENQSVCYSTIEFPECKRNNIYFTDDSEFKGVKPEGHDIGIFNIGDGIVRKIPCFNEDMPLMTIFPQSVWFTPSIRSIVL